MPFHIDTLSRITKRHINLAYNEALHHEGMSSAKVVALITFKNRVISIGYNSEKTHPLQGQYQKNQHAIHIHAEIDAIRKAASILTPEQFTKSTMIIMRVKKNGHWGLSKPCVGIKNLGCNAAIKAFGIGKVYYSTNATGMMESLDI